MVSPVIDEDVMLEALKVSPPEDLNKNVQRLRTGAALLLMDAFDRKVTRDQFMAALGASAELIDMLGRFTLMENVKRFDAATGRVTKADIEVTMAGIHTEIATLTAQCAKMADLIHQCALNEDKVH